MICGFELVINGDEDANELDGCEVDVEVVLTLKTDELESGR
jgi:hypothetical protein